MAAAAPARLLSPIVALGAVVLLAAVLLTACSRASGGAGSGSSAASSTVTPTTSPASPASPPPSASPAPTSPPAAPPDRAQQVLATLSPAQRVGQLLMIGLPAAGSPDPTTAAVRTLSVGNVFLSGRSRAGVAAIAALTGRVQAAAGPVPLLIGTDQEGGEVQVLSGPGFDAMPSGIEQGVLSPATLQTDATRWGGQLAAAGVRVDLGPVLDTVPPGDDDNPPIAGYDREFGHDPATVSAHGVAVIRGLAGAGVAATGKHFPGLGRVTANTDTTAGVTDPTTTTHDPYLQPFTDAIAAGVPLIMVSSAIYSRIDPTAPAAFSSAVVSGLLRGTLGFQGVIISDDLGNAVAVRNVSVGDRAVRFIAAGGDLVLDVSAGQAPALASALLARTQSDPAFAALVDAAALRVLRLKASLGLLG